MKDVEILARRIKDVEERVDLHCDRLNIFADQDSHFIKWIMSVEKSLDSCNESLRIWKLVGFLYLYTLMVILIIIVYSVWK